MWGEHSRGELVAGGRGSGIPWWGGIPSHPSGRAGTALSTRVSILIHHEDEEAMRDSKEMGE